MTKYWEVFIRSEGVFASTFIKAKTAKDAAEEFLGGVFPIHRIIGRKMPLNLVEKTELALKNYDYALKFHFPNEAEDWIVQVSAVNKYNNIR